MFRRLSILLVVVLASPLSAARADVVRLKNGESLVGLVVQDNYKEVSIRIKGELRVFKQAEVASVVFSPEGTDGAVHLGRGRANPEVPPRPPPTEEPVLVRPYLPRQVASAATTAPTSEDFRGAEVVLYSTNWCGFCSKARQYFQSRGIPFSERDIEKESDARFEVARKCREKGLRFTGSVPVLDVNGHMIQGFDVPAIESALKKGTDSF